MATNLLSKLSIATVSTAAISLSLLSANPAQANGFSDGYEVENWTLTNNNNANGFVNTSNAPESITLTAGDDGSYYGGSSWYTATSLADGLVSFDWSYTTNDPYGPGWDPFGYILNGVFTQLSNSFEYNQFGSASFAVLAGDLFGFGVSTDNGDGTAIVTVSNFAAPQSVPEPGTIAALGLIGLGGLLTKKKLNASDN
ncbi:PEP-CTERM sorting domain-containing protein [Limnoraphis robusta]|uniref:PEP-CTERM sorting domain-containing protein n=1 Tax=Limnoraphis robusta TaxID=1118279 RepID=UPI002B1FEF02|nr:PEP-CTERM sorting domain-containing protein [Limnoraphis robusta]MEA5501214.1 PEP-CTERM sorting domain-containing protein [Limnoraphis robusta BA-68 BA1]